jgi:methyl-accepting chemotaxis protein
MVGVPATLLLRADRETLLALQGESAGLAPAREVLELIHLTELHRYFSAAVLGGNSALKGEREAKQADVSAAIARVIDTTASLDDGLLRRHRQQLQSDWQALAQVMSAGGLSAIESAERHGALVDLELTLLDDVAATSGLMLDSDNATYFLVTASMTHLPRLSEALGRARARGTALLDRGSASAEDRAIVHALVDRMHLHFGDAQTALQRLLEAEPGLQAVLKGPADEVESQVQAALQIVDDAVVRPEALRMNSTEYAQRLTQAIEALYRFEGTVTSAVAASLDRRTHSMQAELATTAAIIVALTALAIGFIRQASGSVSRSVAEALRASEALAQGDLSVRVDSHAHDEVGQLVQAINRAATGLERVVVGIKASSESVGAAAAQIAAGNQDLSSRTEEQASSLQQTAASMEQLTATVRNSEQSARQASALATSASQAAGRGGTIVGQVVATMEGMSASSKKIADIISVIDGIAFQTNILALNAAVEAARAGEQGRGFAVVAAEVRNLAQRSAQAAREITALIQDSVARVEDGSRLVREAGSAMDDIVGQVRHVTDLINEISAASVEQSGGIAQVTQAVTQMDQVTQQNAALVEQSAAAASSLHDLAGRLSRDVAAFRLAPEAAHHAAHA